MVLYYFLNGFKPLTPLTVFLAMFFVLSFMLVPMLLALFTMFSLGILGIFIFLNISIALSRTQLQ